MGSTTYPPVFNMPGAEAPLERVSMQTNLRHLCYDFSLACESTILTVSGPVLFQHAGFIPRGDFESAQRQNQSAHANMGRCCGPCYPTLAASNNRCPDVPAGSNALKHFIKLVSKADEGRHRHALVPIRP